VELKGKVVIVTGGASGIGLAMCRRFLAEDARAVVMADVAPGTAEIAHELGAEPAALDVTSQAATSEVVDWAERRFGGIDLFCANAGILVTGGPEVPDQEWRRVMDVNFMAHVYAARSLLPAWVARGRGYLLHTASAAGLLTGLGALPYTVSKHAVVALAEWLAIEHRDDGVRFSCLCPQGVRTPMMEAGGPEAEAQLGPSAMSPDDVAAVAVEGLAAERFLILPHPEVERYMAGKVAERDTWIARMARLRARVQGVASA